MAGFTAAGMDPSNRCRLCRFITVFYLLEDVLEGGTYGARLGLHVHDQPVGGTVFPLADTTDEQLLAWRRDPSGSKYKQTVKCGPGLTVWPKKGKAIIWYNHKVRTYVRTGTPTPCAPQSTVTD